MNQEQENQVLRKSTPPTERYVKLVPTGEVHDDVPVMDGIDVTDEVMALKSAQQPVAWVYPEFFEGLKRSGCWTAYAQDGKGPHPDGVGRIPLYLGVAQSKQKPIAWLGFNPRTSAPEFAYDMPAPSVVRDFNMRPLVYANDTSQERVDETKINRHEPDVFNRKLLQQLESEWVALQGLKRASQPKHDCTRSHPHEDMSKECELRTEIARLQNKLAQPKQDVVAWRPAFTHEGYATEGVWNAGKPTGMDLEFWGKTKVGIEYAYGSPPQRKPLTDEQREEIAKDWRGRNWTVGDIIDAIEAAHGIKGDA